MHEPILLTPQLTRVIRFYKRYDIEVPKELLETHARKPDLHDFPYPLPLHKSDYTCFCAGENEVLWYGGKGGVTRYDPNAARRDDIMMFFSAKRDLMDGDVKALHADGNGVWVLTESGVAHIDMVKMSMEEKAALLTAETLRYVQRHGMTSQMYLSEPWNLASVLPYGHSDNDGSFTGAFAIGEIFHYATLKKEKGDFSPEVEKARKTALRASEATLLLMYIAGRGNGFVARTYLAGSEPVPDDGLFFKKNGAEAVCLNTSAARKRKTVGMTVRADAPVPDRLRKLYTDEGYDDTDITYKGDTSSDEMSIHFLHLLVAHEFLGKDDPEYDELLKNAARATMTHIIENGFVLREADGKPTTWAKWDTDYFSSFDGWADAALNAAEVMMYLNVTMRLTNETGIFKAALDELEGKGYIELTKKHFDRFHQVSIAGGRDDRAETMYGDHMLAVVSFWGLLSLEKDEKKREAFKEGFRTWRYAIAPEFNPGYDFLYYLSVPEDDKPDAERIKTWFYRFSPSRLASPVSLKLRLDIPMKHVYGGLSETSVLPPNDERAIAKYDSDPFYYIDGEAEGMHRLEACYPFTFAYWVGRYFGFIKEA